MTATRTIEVVITGERLERLAGLRLDPWQRAVVTNLMHLRRSENPIVVDARRQYRVFAQDLAMVRLVCSLPDAFYAGAALNRARALRAETGIDLASCIDHVRREISKGRWRPPLDINHERARLADLGRRIAETRKRALGC